MSMLARYTQALRLTGPKYAAQNPGTAVEGYWIDDHSFYFLAEKLEPSLGCIVDVPSIVDCRTRRVQEVMSLAELAQVLNERNEKADQPVDVDALSLAEFDMPDRNTLVVSVKGSDFRIDLGQGRVVESVASREVPPAYSPDGRFACFVKGHDVWLRESATGQERALTTDGAPYYAYGQKSGACLQMISYRRIPTVVGFWSPDSQWFVTRRVDERGVPDVHLVQNVPPGGGRPILHTSKFAYPGDPTPVVTFVAIHVPTARVVVFDAFPFSDTTPWEPLQTVWFGAADTVWAIRRDRFFQKAELIRLDLARGTGRIVLTESVSRGQINFLSRAIGLMNVRSLDASNELIWYSDRDGWAHLYLYDSETGALKNQMTRGPWRVRDLVEVDEKQRKVLFLASGIDADADRAQRSLCSVNFDGSGFEVLLAHDGDIYVSPNAPSTFVVKKTPFQPSPKRTGISPNGQLAVVRYGSVERGNRTDIVDLTTRRGFTLCSAQPAAKQILPRRFTALAADGVTRLHGVMFFPSDFDANKRYPLIDDVYPGPQISHQPQTFRAADASLSMALAELGFITIIIDTRAIPLGSREFQQAGYGSVFEPQLADHAAVVRQLCERHAFIDRERIGAMGYSAGGNATAGAMLRYGDIFKVGVAVCGVYDPRFYSTVYSDRFRGPGTPETFAAQAQTSVAHQLTGKLLLISGDMDENVHVAHTLRLVDALIRANRDFEMLIVPNEGHYLMENNGYVYRRVWDFFVTHLLGETPPRDFEIRFEPHEIAPFDKRYWREGMQR